MSSTAAAALGAAIATAAEVLNPNSCCSKNYEIATQQERLADHDRRQQMSLQTKQLKSIEHFLVLQRSQPKSAVGSNGLKACQPAMTQLLCSPGCS
jgi:hypothetical protein